MQKKNDTFCAMCGFDFLQSNQTTPKTAENNNTIKCPKCGAENDVNDNFCQECGTNLKNSIMEEKPDATTTTKEPHKNNKIYKPPFMCHVIIDFILYSIFTFGASFWLAMMIPLFTEEASSKVYSPSEIDNADNIMHQIYYLASNANTRIMDESIAIYMIFGAVIGLLLVFSIWSVVKYNKLEKRIIDTQELIVELKAKIKE